MISEKCQRSIISAILFLAATANLIANGPEPLLTLEDFAIVGDNSGRRFSMLQDIDEVADILGSPKRQEAKKTENNDTFLWNIYEGLLIGFWKNWGKVSLLQVTGPGYSTSRGIRIGDDRKAILKAYGARAYIWKEGIQYGIEIPHGNIEREYLLTFLLENDIVKRIVINLA